MTITRHRREILVCSVFCLFVLYKLTWHETVHSISLNYRSFEMARWPATGSLAWLPVNFPIRCAGAARSPVLSLGLTLPGRKAFVTALHLGSDVHP